MPENAANRIIKGLGRLRVTQGEGAGDALNVFPWEKRFVKGALSPGRTLCALSVARGNGKTTIVSALALAALVGPLRRPRGEVILVASSWEQACIGFRHILAFMRPAIDANPKRFRVQDSNNRASIEDRDTGCRIRCIGSDPRRAHGLAGHLFLLDEPAQWERNRADAMYSALKTSLGKIKDGRLWALGTLPADPVHWFRKMFEKGGADYAQMHQSGAGDDPLRPATWAKANPSLRYMPTLRKTIEAEARQAAMDPGALASFRALRLNLGESDVERAMLIDPGVWRSIEGDPVPATPGRSVWGIDLGGTAAFSAVARYDPAGGRLDGLAMIGDDPGLAERGLRDGVGRLYLDLEDAGELLPQPGRVVDPATLVREALRRWGRPAALVADRWREGELRDALAAVGFPAATLVVRGQGYKDGGADVREFRRACLSGRVVPVRSLLLRSAMAEAMTVSDPAANHKLAKGSEGGRRTLARDDVAAACILAVAEGARRAATPPRRRARVLVAG